MASDNEPDSEPVPQYAPGGLVTGAPADISDPVVVLIDTRYERIFTAREVRRWMAAKPGSRDALQGPA